MKNPPGYETIAERRGNPHAIGDADAMREQLRAMALEAMKAQGCDCTPVIQIQPGVDLAARRGAAPIRVWHVRGCAHPDAQEQENA